MLVLLVSSLLILLSILLYLLRYSRPVRLNVRLFCGYIGPFGGYIGLFCGYIGLLRGYIGLFYGYTGNSSSLTVCVFSVCVYKSARQMKWMAFSFVLRAPLEAPGSIVLLAPFSGSERTHRPDAEPRAGNLDLDG